MAIDIKKNDEVITVSNTAVPTVSAIVSCNAKPVFVDVNEKDFLSGAQKFFEIVIDCFVKGDLKNIEMYIDDKLINTTPLKFVNWLVNT